MSEPDLTPHQRLRAAYAHILDGIDQHKIAAIMGTNQGRVNEAVRIVEWAINNKIDALDVARGRAKVVRDKNHKEEEKEEETHE